jgi:hypothetical protein
VDKIQLALVVSYLLITCYFFVNWLIFSIRHPNSSPEGKFLTLVILVITTGLWFLIIPMSCLKILKTRKLEVSIVIPVIVALFAFSMYLYAFLTS